MKNDAQLQADVEQELRWEPSVHAEQIGVSVKDGVVELDGNVDSYYEKWAAERAAMRVSSVKAVASEIKVEFDIDVMRRTQGAVLPVLLVLHGAAAFLSFRGSVPFEIDQGTDAGRHCQRD